MQDFCACCCCSAFHGKRAQESCACGIAVQERWSWLWRLKGLSLFTIAPPKPKFTLNPVPFPQQKYGLKVGSSDRHVKCEHGRRKTRCKQGCGGNSLCEHVNQKGWCLECWAEGKFYYGKPPADTPTPVGKANGNEVKPAVPAFALAPAPASCTRSKSGLVSSPNPALAAPKKRRKFGG